MWNNRLQIEWFLSNKVTIKNKCIHSCVKVRVAQSCPNLCDPMDYTDHGILQARVLEWVPFYSPGNLPNPVGKPRPPTLQADFSPAEPQGKPPQF